MKYHEIILILLIWGFPNWLTFQYLFLTNYDALSYGTILLTTITFFCNGLIIILLIFNKIIKNYLKVLYLLKNVVYFNLLSAIIYILWVFNISEIEYNFIFGS